MQMVHIVQMVQIGAKDAQGTNGGGNGDANVAN